MGIICFMVMQALSFFSCVIQLFKKDMYSLITILFPIVSLYYAYKLQQCQTEARAPHLPMHGGYPTAVVAAPVQPMTGMAAQPLTQGQYPQAMTGMAQPYPVQARQAMTGTQ